MDQKLLKVYQELELQRFSLLAMIKPLNEEQRDRKVNGRWSINQILSHLVTSERLSLTYMKKKSNAIETLDETGIIEDVKIILLKISQRIPLRYTAPKLVTDQTPHDSFSEIEERWTRARKDLLTFIENLSPQHSKKKIYKHPVAGRLNVHQALSFFKEHITHHLPQIKRLLS